MNKTAVTLIIIIIVVIGIIAAASISSNNAPSYQVPGDEPNLLQGITSNGTSTATSTISTSSTSTQTTILSTTTATSTGSATTTRNFAVTYTATGFSPNSITINRGDSVTWTNRSSERMWVASDPHPQHTNLPGFDERNSTNTGQAWTYTFNVSGAHTYHNHVNPTMRGTVIVR